MVTNILFTFVFFPILTWIYLFCAKKVLFLCSEQFSLQSSWIWLRRGKNTKENKQLLVMFWGRFGLVQENVELSHIHLALCLILKYLLSDSMVDCGSTKTFIFCFDFDFFSTIISKLCQNFELWDNDTSKLCQNVEF